jgi:hypothetical protein
MPRLPSSPRWFAAPVLAGLCTLACADGAAITPFSSAAPGEAPSPWKFVTLPHKTPTTFAVVELDGAKVLKIEADDSYGNLVHAVQAQPGAQATLAWRWRVDRLVDGADLRTRAGDDSPAKVCVFFAFDAARLSLGERTKLSLAHSTTGQDVPTEALCYVWDNQLPVDTALPNAFTKRVRVIVLQSGPARLGHWVAEKRDIAVDYQRLFGDESGGRIPAITGVAVAADADNTHAHALAYVGDLTLTP